MGRPGHALAVYTGADPRGGLWAKSLGRRQPGRRQRPPRTRDCKPTGGRAAWPPCCPEDVLFLLWTDLPSPPRPRKVQASDPLTSVATTVCNLCAGGQHGLRSPRRGGAGSGQRPRSDRTSCVRATPSRLLLSREGDHEARGERSLHPETNPAWRPALRLRVGPAPAPPCPAPALPRPAPPAPPLPCPSCPAPPFPPLLPRPAPPAPPPALLPRSRSLLPRPRPLLPRSPAPPAPPCPAFLPPLPRAPPPRPSCPRPAPPRLPSPTPAPAPASPPPPVAKPTQPQSWVSRRSS